MTLARTIGKVSFLRTACGSRFILTLGCEALIQLDDLDAYMRLCMSMNKAIDEVGVHLQV